MLNILVCVVAVSMARATSRPLPVVSLAHIVYCDVLDFFICLREETQEDEMRRKTTKSRLRKAKTPDSGVMDRRRVYLI
jgi:hypothetical protein